MKTPIKIPSVKPLKVDDDLLRYEKARFFHKESKDAHDVKKAVLLYFKLLKNGHYEVLDQLIEIFYNGVPGVIEKSEEITEKLFTTKVKVDKNYKDANVTRPIRFPDAISNSSILKSLRLFEVKEKTKFSVKSDFQNTHDSGVTGTIKSTVQKLVSVVQISTEKTKVLQELREHIRKSKLSIKKQLAAERVLDKTSVNLEEISIIGMKEVDLLTLIYNRINDPVNEENKNILLENLIEEMADSEAPDGYLYCTIGRVSRMLNALSTVDKLVVIKPVWAIRQEMLQDAGTLKTRMVDALSDVFRDRLEKNEELSDKVDAKFRELLRKRYKVIYVDSEILTQEKLDKELDEWIEFV